MSDNEEERKEEASTFSFGVSTLDYKHFARSGDNKAKPNRKEDKRLTSHPWFIYLGFNAGDEVYITEDVVKELKPIQDSYQLILL